MPMPCSWKELAVIRSTTSGSINMDKFGTAAEERTHAVEEIVEKQKEAPGYRRMTPNKEQRKMGKKMPRCLFLYQI